MCGIVSIFNANGLINFSPLDLNESARKIRHRGPDWSGSYLNENIAIAHERLAIVDPLSGGQPLLSEDGNIILAVNGEIYNHKELRKEVSPEYLFSTESDCEVLIPLYLKYGPNFMDKLNGIFGFTLYDKSRNLLIAARDHVGIIPLYTGHDQNGNLYFSSELKAIEGQCSKIEVLLPGTAFHSEKGYYTWYKPKWNNYNLTESSENCDFETATKRIRSSLDNAVIRQLMSDVPYGVLLSGGLDSSITAALAKKHAEKRIESNETEDAWWPKLHSFAIGLEGSPDLEASKHVADHIGTIHHSITFTVEEGINALSDVIYHLETYDVTTVRASTPMYLLARVIKSMGIKMVLSGEGADEIFGGYLYFHKAPNPNEFQKESIRKVKRLYQYDCLRANKSLAAWGVEGRVPFLDREFLDIAMCINPEFKMVTEDKPIEKYILRKAFEDLLPPEIAWRQKEQFSDGVGYSWIDELKKLVEIKVSADQLENASFRFPVNTPKSKEEYYYRTLFELHFPSKTAAETVPSVPSIACSSPEALEWDESFRNTNDPSGRAVNVHNQKY